MQLPTWTVIDTVPATSPDAPLATFDAVVKLTQNRPIGSKLTYIYTGGSWVHARGAGGLDKWTDERQPYGGAVELTQWRWKVEEKVLACEYCNYTPHPRLTCLATAVQGIVIRPSVLYGRSGSLIGMMVFGPATKAGKGQSFKAVGRGDTRLLTIHADDLADLYVRIAERVSR